MTGAPVAARTAGSPFQLLVDRLRFPESPRWHAGTLWLSEKRAGRVVRVAPDGAVTEVARVGGEPSGLGWSVDDRLLVVSMADQRLLQQSDAGLVPVADLRHHARGKCNDMVVDRAGRAYIGHFGYDLAAGETPAAASLLLVRPSGEVAEAAGDLHFPNGCVLIGDSRLVVAESAANRLTEFDVADDGALTGRRLFAELGETVPDGICLDAEGAIWVADPLHGEVVRVLRGGRVTDRLTTGDGAFACVLGGVDGRALYVCTYSAAASTRPDGPPVGQLVMTTVEVPTGGSP